MISVNEQNRLLSIVALMAVKPLISSLALCYLIQYVACFCNVTCTTDYNTSLNCSCSGTVPSSPILLEAECRYFEDQVNDSCEITPPQSWCIIQPEDFFNIISVETYCTARVKHTGKEDKMKTDDSTDWKLYKLVKPQHPVNVQVTENIDSYNVTWQMDENIYLDGSLMYRVRITTNNNYLKDPVYYPVREDQRYLVLNSLKLQPGTEYVANVQASVNPGSSYQGPWSEWSSTVEWRTTEGDAKLWCQWPVLLTILPCLILCYLFKILWPKRLHMMNYSPSPEDFFKPLYHTYGGDFKKWVGPVFIFSELDPLEKHPPTQRMTEKQLDILGLSRLRVEEDSSSNSGDQGTCHSAGHISIDTVMVSGEEGALSGSSWVTYKCSQGGESFSQYTGGSRGGIDTEADGPLGAGAEEEGGLSGQSGRRASMGLPAMKWQLQLQARNYQPEQISLDSEDGYPPMVLDLDSVDTIDSGVFVESDCSSPVNSNFESEKQIDSALLSGVGSSPSEYVKQWVMGNTMQEDSTNSTM
ncbi:interleukin-21 receptor-like [Salvelinus fontinalis]|uniref:interleukin-21 receptor-like n=1 Tax=Salvelinus fontinalis TaxID=8038 RepID=UPI0024856DD2|nr:interleukin-21 receptor-like [Salvelinus fontinalis]